MTQSVLIVDDSEFVRETVGAALSACGEVQVLQACNGREALEILARDATVGAVVLDVAMPIVGARDVLRGLTHLSRGPTTTETPAPRPRPFIVAVGGAGEAQALEECRSLGADAVLTKPLDMGTLGALVRRGLNEAKQKHEGEKSLQ
jgi:CheY-like chemotaxis protein